MTRIAIIDDRKEIRETLKRSLDSELPAGWEIIDIDPIPDLNLYRSWIIENDISAFVIDERLHEELSESRERVEYNGHNLVDFLRVDFPTLPLFIVTSYPDEEGLKECLKDVEEIIGRTDFSRKIEIWTSRIVRAAQRYLDTYQSELSELSEKAEKIAKGEATDNDLERVRALHSKIGFAFSTTSFQENIEVINELEAKFTELELLQKEINEYLDRKK